MEQSERAKLEALCERWLTRVMGADKHYHEKNQWLVYKARWQGRRDACMECIEDDLRAVIEEVCE